MDSAASAMVMGGPAAVIVICILGGIAYAIQPYFPDWDLQSIVVLEVIALIGIGAVIFGLFSLLGQSSSGGNNSSARSRH